MISDLNLEFVRHSSGNSLNFHMLEATLKKSTGEAAMSDQDVKIALVNLIQLARHQEELILVLRNHVEQLENKKTFFQKLFRK
jgi:hypothetical protein